MNMTSNSSVAGPGVHRLDAIPAEIIRRIATLLPCESVLALFKVSRVFYKACNDRIVFREIIENGNGLPRALPVWDLRVLESDASTSQWARYALADSKAARLACEPDWDTGMLQSFLRFGPQLLAANHPLVDYLKVPELTGELDAERACSCWELQTASFCATLRIFTSVSSVVLYTSPQDASHALRVADPRLEPAFRSVLFAHLQQPMEVRDLIPDTYRLALRHTLANRAVGAFACQLRESRMWAGCPQLEVPSFASFMDLPPPFSSDSSRQFSKCHLKTMMSNKFLEDGEWFGFYCYSIGSPSVSRLGIDPPMHGIRFRVSDDDQENGLVMISGQGRDGVGAFEISGAIIRDTGGIVAIKQYGEGLSWPWMGLMTPFGMAGSWGDKDWGGWFWLWKASSSEATRFSKRQNA